MDVCEKSNIKYNAHVFLPENADGMSEVTQNAQFIIDREAREIMYLVASVCPSVRPFVRLCALSCLNRLTYDLDYQSKVFVCVSVISWCMRIIARMRSIGF